MKDNKRRSILFTEPFENLPQILETLHKERGDSINLLIMKAIKEKYDQPK